jgi:hypothetical protein
MRKKYLREKLERDSRKVQRVCEDTSRKSQRIKIRSQINQQIVN